MLFAHLLDVEAVLQQVLDEDAEDEQRDGQQDEWLWGDEGQVGLVYFRIELYIPHYIIIGLF